MIYLLGGPPRVGKSTIARTFARQRGISAVSTDALGAVLEAVLDPTAAPGLRAVTPWSAAREEARATEMAEDPARRLRQQLEESDAVWRAVEPFVGCERAQGRDVVMEGVAILPARGAELSELDVRCVFVGYQGAGLVDRIRGSARGHPHDWIRDAGDRYVDAFAAFVVEMSRHVEAEARRHGLPYVPMEARPFDEAVVHAGNVLAGDLDPSP